MISADPKASVSTCSIHRARVFLEGERHEVAVDGPSPITLNESMRDDVPDHGQGHPPISCIESLFGLNVADVNGAAGRIQLSGDRHALASECPSFLLIV